MLSRILSQQSYNEQLDRIYAEFEKSRPDVLIFYLWMGVLGLSLVVLAVMLYFNILLLFTKSGLQVILICAGIALLGIISMIWFKYFAVKHIQARVQSLLDEFNFGTSSRYTWSIKPYLPTIWWIGFWDYHWDIWLTLNDTH